MINEILERAIKKCGSKELLAKKVGVDWRTVYRWASKESMPQGKFLLKLIELAGKK